MRWNANSFPFQIGPIRPICPMNLDGTHRTYGTYGTYVFRQSISSTNGRHLAEITRSAKPPAVTRDKSLAANFWDVFTFFRFVTFSLASFPDFQIQPAPSQRCSDKQRMLETSCRTMTCDEHRLTSGVGSQGKERPCERFKNGVD